MTNKTIVSIAPQRYTMRQKIDLTVPIYRYQPFPTTRYHRTQPHIVVNSQAEMDALDPEEWADSPWPVEKGGTPAPLPDLPQCSGPVITEDRGATYMCGGCGETLNADSLDTVKARHINVPTQDLTPEGFLSPIEQKLADARDEIASLKEQLAEARGKKKPTPAAKEKVAA